MNFFFIHILLSKDCGLFTLRIHLKDSIKIQLKCIEIKFGERFKWFMIGFDKSLANDNGSK